MSDVKGKEMEQDRKGTVKNQDIDVEKYVDGDFAEIYLKMKGKLESDTVRVYIDD